MLSVTRMILHIAELSFRGEVAVCGHDEHSRELECRRLLPLRKV